MIDNLDLNLAKTNLGPLKFSCAKITIVKIASTPSRDPYCRDYRPPFVMKYVMLVISLNEIKLKYI